MTSPQLDFEEFTSDTVYSEEFVKKVSTFEIRQQARVLHVLHQLLRNVREGKLQDFSKVGIVVVRIDAEGDLGPVMIFASVRKHSFYSWLRGRSLRGKRILRRHFLLVEALDRADLSR